MKKFFYSLLILFLLSVSIPAGKASAQTRLQYPIPDLGFCRDAKECSLYCDIPENKAACWSYGKYKLGPQVLGVTTISEEEKQYMREKAKQYGITFPIADLGNCAGPQECRDFCEQPSNHQTCMDFAKKKGFHKEVEKVELLEKARTELGCTSMESCKAICDQDNNRCETFVKKHGVYQKPPQSSGRYSAEKKQELIKKAQTELGCTSMESCKSTCEKNPERCMEFAKKHGFDKGSEQSEHSESGRQYGGSTQSGASPNYGTQRFEKGSCDSEESCKLYCQEHPDECPGFKGYTRATEGGIPQQQHQGSYTGPSGCRTEAECKSWCETHPAQCPGFSEAKAREESFKQPTTNTQQYNSYPDSQQYPSPSTQPAYNTTQPSSGSYVPQPTP